MQKRLLMDRATRRQAREALYGIPDVITNQMAEGDAVTIAGSGRFEAKEHRKRRVEGPDSVQENLLHADLSLTF